MPRIYISVGSNNDREKNIHAAINALTEHYGEIICSPVYETEAYGFTGEPFFNLVVALNTDETPQTVIHVLKNIEDENGRQRSSEKFSDRTLDLDLLTWSDIVDERLKIPREDIMLYAFVLLPLADIAANDKHPESGLTYAQLWQQFKQQQKTEINKVDFNACGENV